MQNVRTPRISPIPWHSVLVAGANMKAIHAASSAQVSGSQLGTVQYPPGIDVSQVRPPVSEQSVPVAQSSPILAWHPSPPANKAVAHNRLSKHRRSDIGRDLTTALAGEKHNPKLLTQANRGVRLTLRLERLMTFFRLLAGNRQCDRQLKARVLHGYLYYSGLH